MIGGRCVLVNTESWGSDCSVVANLVWQLVKQLCEEESESWCGGLGLGGGGGCEEKQLVCSIGAKCPACRSLLSQSWQH